MIEAKRFCELCCPQLRECNLQPVQSEFQSLISLLQELARHSTKVVNRAWSSLLNDLNAGLERRDYLYVADVLQWELLPALNDQAETLSQDVLS